MERWKKEDSESEKSLMGRGLRLRLDEYEKNGGKMSEERQNTINRYRFFLSYDPVAEAEEARKHAETIKKLDAMNREREERKRQAERETEKKYEDVKAKSVKQEADARQTDIKKKKKDEYEMGQ